MQGNGHSGEAPDINVSDANFTPHGNAIRFGLAAVKRMSATTPSNQSLPGESSLAATARFMNSEKVDLRLLNKRVLESLIKSGAMDGLGRRAQLMAVLDRAIEGAQKSQRDAESGQHGLFGVFQEEEVSSASTKLPEIRTGMSTQGWPTRRRFSDSSLPAIPWRSIATNSKTCMLSAPRKSGP